MATKADKRLADIAIKNQALLERLKSGFERDYAKVFPEVEKAIGATLSATKVDNLSELTKKQLETLLRELREAQFSLYAESNKDLVEKLSNTSGYVAGKEAMDLNTLRVDADLAAIDWNIPKASNTWSYVNSTPIAATGELMDPFIQRITAGNVARVEGAVRNGWAQGKTIGEVTRQIYGTKKNAYKDGLTQMNRRGVQAMVRTATQHTAMASRMSFFMGNDDLISGYKFVATLDLRTTSKCRSLDGKVFELGKGPLPPVHVGCRSSIIPNLGPEFDFLEEGATRSSSDGYVDANTTYYDWLKKQSPEDIKEVLGKTRAELFRNGGLTAEQFAKYNMGQSFEPLTLEQLYLKDPAPFKAAGVTLPGVTQSELDLLGPPAPAPAPILSNAPSVDLNILPLKQRLDPEDRQWARVSIPQADRFPDLSKVEFSQSFGGYATDPDYGIEIDFGRLLATQDTVRVSGVEKYAKQGKSTRDTLVYKTNGQYIVADGHHTLEGALLRGETSGKVTLLDLDDWTSGKDYRPTPASVAPPVGAAVKDTLSALRDKLPGTSAFRNEEVVKMISQQWNAKVIPTLDDYRPAEKAYILEYAKKIQP